MAPPVSTGRAAGAPPARSGLSRRAVLATAGRATAGWAAAGWVSVGGVAAGGHALAGCTQAVPEQAPAPVADRLRVSLEAGDADAFAALFTPGARTLGRAWFDTWRSFAWVSLRAEGPGRVGVWWRLGEEALPSATSLDLHMVGGRIDGVDDPRPVPIWLHHPTVRAGVGNVAVLSADPRSDPAVWADAAATASERVRAAGLDGWDGWAGELAVDVPLDTRAFDRRNGTATGAGAAAYTTAEPGRAPVIVVDPTVTRDWNEDDRAGVLTHEAVHVALGRAGDAAPTWVVEGLAEWVALPFWPWARSFADQVLAGEPETASLPVTADFRKAATRDGAYARAEAAIAGLVAAYGSEQVLGWARDWRAAGVPSVDTCTQLLRAELHRRR